MTTVGIIGAGGMGNVHANHYRKMPDVDLVVFDVDPERLGTFCQRHSAGPMESLDQLIDRCDVADVCLPTDLHTEIGVRCLAAGRPTLLEKPMAGSTADARRLVETARATGSPLMPGQVVRFFPEFAAAQRLVREGAIGTPAAARMRRGGKAPQGAGGWFKDHSKSGGVLLDLAVHDFDWLRWTVGEVTQVYSRSVRMSPTTPETVDGDYALTTLSFENGCIAHVESTWLDPGGFRATFEVCGSAGMVEYDSRQASTLRTVTDTLNRAEAPLAPADDPYYRQLKGFLDAVQGESQLPVSAEEGFAAVAIAEAAILSCRTGKPVIPEPL